MRPFLLTLDQTLAVMVNYTHQGPGPSSYYQQSPPVYGGGHSPGPRPPNFYPYPPHHHHPGPSPRGNHPRGSYGSRGYYQQQAPYAAHYPAKYNPPSYHYPSPNAPVFTPSWQHQQQRPISPLPSSLCWYPSPPRSLQRNPKPLRLRFYRRHPPYPRHTLTLAQYPLHTSPPNPPLTLISQNGPSGPGLADRKTPQSPQHHHLPKSPSSPRHRPTRLGSQNTTPIPATSAFSASSSDKTTPFTFDSAHQSYCRSFAAAVITE